MHLKTLTVRGFKSFASATTFEFEPGVTAVVGPNGSGKSNVVDALAWVMGEQGAKSLRGASMEDVIFAGTSGRAALGRAQVSLTIDNADGALPIAYSEVTISRTLFRSGGSEYAINARSCRLLDIQELLSDSGLGREMHAIVGQGRLDRILQATPEERRGFIEEASGILKHRRRREKTLRKLDSLQANLDRLEDLVGEIQRQLTPLGRQARTARRAQRIQYDVRDAKARLLADDLVAARAAHHTRAATARGTRERQRLVEEALAGLTDRLRGTEARAAEATPALTAARTAWYELSTVRERYRSLAALAAERRRLLGTAPAPPERADLERLRDQAAHSRREAERLAARVAEAHRELEDWHARREAAQREAGEAQQRVARLLREAADRRAGEARRAAAVTAARSALDSAEADIDRLRAEITDVTERTDAARREHGRLREDAERLGAAAGTRTEAAEHAREAAELAREHARASETQHQRVLREHHSAAARLDTLRQSVPRPDGSEAVTRGHADAVLAAVPDAVRVSPGWERAVAAALGPWAEALTVSSREHAARILAALRTRDEGRVSVLVAHGPRAVPDGAEPSPPAGALAAAEAVHPAGQRDDTTAVVAAVRNALAHTVLVSDGPAALAVLDAAPGLRAVTREGDVFTSHTAQGGGAEAPGGLELHARMTAAETEAERWAAQLDAASAAAGEAEERHTAAARGARGAAEAARAAQREASKATTELSRAEAVVGSADAELQRRRDALDTARRRSVERQAQLGAALEHARTDPEGQEPAGEREQLTAATARERAEAAAREAHEAETQSRLSVRGLEEQHRTAVSREQSRQRAVRAEQAAHAQARRRAERRRAQAAVAGAVAEAAGYLRGRAEDSAARAARARDAAETERAGLDEAAGRLRRERDELTEQLSAVTEQLHREELDLAQREAQLRALDQASLEDLGMTPDFLVEHYGPHLPVPAAEENPPATVPHGGGGAGDAAEGAPDREPGSRRPPAITDPGVPFVRAEQETRLRRAEKQLRALGRVNPLALEEFAALEERHRFLAEQLEDVKNSRADLRTVIRQVDEHVEHVFALAYRDTAEQFTDVFATLFPGGEGRLRLTDPDDLLASGVEVEARPAGKKIKRLSLLSGGERSLTALALLIAIFRARPSPFYVMDEVEAALDDRNLGRLLGIFRRLRENSQLIIVTHQKRTMEIADALYGVSMRGDGVSLVVGQKLAEPR